MPTGPDALRSFNRARVVDAVRAGASTRAAICSETGLARSTVSGLVGELLEMQVLVQAPGPARGRGRPAGALVVATPRSAVLAIDFGHSHCRVALVSVTGGSARRQAQVLAEQTVRLDVDAAPDAALREARRVARGFMDAPGAPTTVGGAIGVPAPVDIATGAVGDGNLLPRWVDRRPAAELGEQLGIPMLIDNDANLGAVAEAGLGAARGARDLIYVKSSTGIGAGLLLGGRIHHGLRGRAGEIGHVPVDTSGHLCRCGNRGCLETVASVTEVLAAAQARSAERVSWPDLLDMVHRADPGALRIVCDAGRLTGRVLADLANTLSPQQIVLGGDLAQAGAPLVEGVRESMARYAQPGLARHIEVSLGVLGPAAEMLGAALLAAEVHATQLG